VATAVAVAATVAPSVGRGAVALAGDDWPAPSPLPLPQDAVMTRSAAAGRSSVRDRTSLLDAFVTVSISNPLLNPLRRG
jgi:hypothetical protein